MKKQTLISLKGMRRDFSSLESKPRSLDASLKFLFVAAKAFMSSFFFLCLVFDQNAVLKRWVCTDYYAHKYIVESVYTVYTARDLCLGKIQWRWS